MFSFKTTKSTKLPLPKLISRILIGVLIVAYVTLMIVANIKLLNSHKKIKTLPFTFEPGEFPLPREQNSWHYK
jgi:hypothetical protein